MKRYDSYIDSGIEVLGKVPSSWKKSKFKFQHFEQDLRVGEDSTEYDLLSLTKKGIILRDIESGKGKFPESFDSYKKVKKDDLIFCLYDIEETPRTVGLSELNGMITGSYKIFNSKDVIPKFTYYTFLVIDDVKGLKPYYTGLRNVIRPETFKSLPFFVPPLSEQQQIVSFLDTKTSLIDSLIEKTERKIDLLKEKRTSLINEVVTKGLNPNVEMKESGVEWIGEIPRDWEIKKLKHISDVRPSNVDKHIYENEIQVRLCNYTDVYYNETINSNSNLKKGSCNENEYEKFKLEKGDVIITKDSETPDDIGVPVYIEETLENVVCGYHLTMIKPISVTGKFIFRFIECDRTRRYFELSSNGVTRFGLGKSSIENLVLPIPSETEQQQIVEYLDEQTQKIDKTISIEEKRIELLKEYRQSLISEVVTGKRKVVE